MKIRVWGARGSVPAPGPEMNRYGGNTSCGPVAFRDAPATEWRIGDVMIRAEAVTHRGPTLGYRITEGDTTLCYIPDHEPALGAPLTQVDNEWISGYDLARDADLLIHDCQYTDAEYPAHVGWGHSALEDTLTFATRVGARQALLFHHDPLHTDEMLNAIAERAQARWGELGHAGDTIALAREGAEIEFTGAGALVQAVSDGRPTAGTSAAPELSTRG
jgi:phosphoribosyl 1,2-cyclic phosphodiesterase